MYKQNKYWYVIKWDQKDYKRKYKHEHIICTNIISIGMSIKWDQKYYKRKYKHEHIICTNIISSGM